MNRIATINYYCYFANAGISDVDPTPNQKCCVCIYIYIYIYIYIHFIHSGLNRTERSHRSPANAGAHTTMWEQESHRSECTPHDLSPDPPSSPPDEISPGSNRTHGWGEGGVGESGMTAARTGPPPVRAHRGESYPRARTRHWDLVT